MARARRAAERAVPNDGQAVGQAEDQAPVGGRLMRALDYASLTPMHQEPIRSPQHRNRWVRVWVSPNAVEAYSKGEALPEGSLVVMSSVEDRWGRPGYEIGPLYTLEAMPGGKARLGLYWSNVPESRRGEVDGQSSVNWLGANPGLAGCAECHSEGLAPIKARAIRPRVAAPQFAAPSAPSAPRPAPAPAAE
jgi:hypothetical protein